MLETLGKCAIMEMLIPGSSMVEQEAVNFEVTGSSPVRGAIEKSSNFCSEIFLSVLLELDKNRSPLGALHKKKIPI